MFHERDEVGRDEESLEDELSTMQAPPHHESRACTTTHSYNDPKWDTTQCEWHHLHVSSSFAGCWLAPMLVPSALLPLCTCAPPCAAIYPAADIMSTGRQGPLCGTGTWCSWNM